MPVRTLYLEGSIRRANRVLRSQQDNSAVASISLDSEANEVALFVDGRFERADVCLTGDAPLAIVAEAAAPVTRRRRAQRMLPRSPASQARASRQPPARPAGPVPP